MGREKPVNSNARNAVKMVDPSEMSFWGQPVLRDSPGHRDGQKQNCHIKSKIADNIDFNKYPLSAIL